MNVDFSDEYLKFARREFSFTLAGDIYLRYQSFESSIEFRKELVKLCPHKIDIGAVYSTNPKQYRAIKATSFKLGKQTCMTDIAVDDIEECLQDSEEEIMTIFYNYAIVHCLKSTLFGHKKKILFKGK